MIQVPINPANEQLNALLSQATQDDVVLMDNGRAVGVLIGFADEDDWFDYQLEHDPRFHARVRAARAEIAEGKVVSLEDLKKRYAETPPASAGG
jgi:PHD/YefM family antitoxin component YafN of YafNO toxin-antitoxin module